MADCWTPDRHTYTGECHGRFVDPHYPTMPDYIRVYDTAVRAFPRKKRDWWRKARNRALHRWTYPFEVVEKGLSPGDYTDGGITLGVYDGGEPAWAANSYGGFGLEPIDFPASSDYDPDAWAKSRAWALIHANEVRNANLSNVTGRLTGVIAHEVGHALGFGHGGAGIMESSVGPPYYPDEYEIHALVAYYGRA